MSGRDGRLAARDIATIGQSVAYLRAQGWRWKALEELFDRDRTQLWRWERAAMQQKTRAMQHHDACSVARSP